MKKIIALFLTFTILVLFVGCKEIQSQNTGTSPDAATNENQLQNVEKSSNSTTKILNLEKAWSGEFSEEKLISAINEYKNNYTNVVLEQGGASSISFETDFEVSSCSVIRLSRIDDTDIEVELNGYIDLFLETGCDGRIITIPVDWWYTGGSSWVNNYFVWSYLVRVKDANGSEHYYYFRVDYSSYAQLTNQGAETYIGSLSDRGYFAPNYKSTSELHSDEFLEILKRDGYYRNGAKDHNYNTDNITSVVNITPKSISDETSDVEFFYVNTHCFLMVNKTIYRYDTVGGYHLQLCFWDYDGNGTKDLVSYHTWGSGLSYLCVSVFDLTSMKNINVITRMILSEPAFSFGCKNGVIYIDGAELTCSDGVFYCSAFQ